jgi:hypothetical protein
MPPRPDECLLGDIFSMTMVAAGQTKAVVPERNRVFMVQGA